MPSYYVSSYTQNSITLTITPSGDYIYFKVYCRTVGGTELENTWIAATATRNYTIYGLSAGTQYVINVGYNTSATEGTCTWMGSQTVTTSGGSGGGGGGTGSYYYYACLQFNANGGSGAPGTQYGENTSSAVYFSIPYTQPTRSGYTFLGWSFASDSTEGTYPMGTTVAVLGSTTGYNYYTLYAVWQKETEYYYVNVTLNSNGGSGADGTYIYYAANSQHVLLQFPTATPTRNGYVFTGWSRSPTGTAEYHGGDWYYLVSSSTVHPGTNHTFYAVWEEAGGGVQVYNGGWKSATPYVYYNGAWVKATPYVYNGGWKKAT